jgi:hypothetical protein
MATEVVDFVLAVSFGFGVINTYGLQLARIEAVSKAFPEFCPCSYY